jgi:hypothetical protein
MLRPHIIKKWLYTGFLFFAAIVVFAQNSGEGEAVSMPRGSIPAELIRPRRGEAPRYPVDTVIGALGQGEASGEAFAFARRVAAALTAGRQNDPSLAAMNKVLLEGYISAVGNISPRSYRLGGGREEADGAVSFLIRFIGREQAITGELFIRLGAAGGAAAQSEAAESGPRVWLFEELILEESRSRETENGETRHRFDFPPYERLF